MQQQKQRNKRMLHATMLLYLLRSPPFACLFMLVFRAVDLMRLIYGLPPRLYALHLAGENRSQS